MCAGLSQNYVIFSKFIPIKEKSPYNFHFTMTISQKTLVSINAVILRGKSSTGSFTGNLLYSLNKP